LTENHGKNTFLANTDSSLFPQTDKVCLHE